MNAATFHRATLTPSTLAAASSWRMAFQIRPGTPRYSALKASRISPRMTADITSSDRELVSCSEPQCGGITGIPAWSRRFLPWYSWPAKATMNCSARVVSIR